MDGIRRKQKDGRHITLNLSDLKILIKSQRGIKKKARPKNILPTENALYI